MSDKNTLKLLELIKPSTDFSITTSPPSPDYSDLSNWAAMPFTEGSTILRSR